MPASLLYEFDNANNVISGAAGGLEDRRAFELALELSLLGLGTESGDNVNSLFSTANAPTIATAPLTNNANPFENDSRISAKRSQNTTECVPVPSSEHVAEIVGRQGCKIKALRAKTNTYIKTPVRGEEPVFVVTGRKEDVSSAKREILSAAEHFSQIRAQRKNNPGSVGPAPNAHLPGHITIQVRVPYRVVGLVVGPKGATIKRIQQQTNTYIITPSRDKDPVFEVTGLPEDVETARKEIEAHIAIRTGGIIDSTTGSVGTPDESTSDFSNSPLLSLDNPFSPPAGMPNFNGALYKSSDPFSAFSANFVPSNGLAIGSQTSASSSLLSNSPTDIFGNNAIPGKFADIYSLFSANSLPFAHGSGSNSGKNTSQGSYDTDEGIGDSPTFEILGTKGAGGSVWPDLSQRSGFVLSGMGSNMALSNNVEGPNLDFHRRSSSLESNINSSSSVSSCVSSSAPATASII